MENYIPYGEEWVKQMMKMKKVYLINMIRKIALEKKELEQRLKK